MAKLRCTEKETKNKVRNCYSKKIALREGKEIEDAKPSIFKQWSSKVLTEKALGRGDDKI
jgi:hypothetical protein